MELKPFWFSSSMKKWETKSFFVMRAISFFALLLSVSALAQSPVAKISLSLRSRPLEEAFREIRKQTGFEFVYTREQLKRSRPVTLYFEAAPLTTILDACFKDQPFAYLVDGNHIVVRDRNGTSSPAPAGREVSGIVRDEEGQPLSNITVAAKNSVLQTSTAANGTFVLKNVLQTDILLISGIGFQPMQLAVRGQDHLDVRLSIAINEMDQTLVIAYGTTTRRLSTANVSKVSSAEIERQPVSNVLAALEGRVAGMLITQSTGLPGSSFKVQVRGRTAIDPSITDDQPLFIIDGIPFAPNNNYLNSIGSALGFPSASSRAGGLSPFSMINPGDIESVEVLKDADATAIYGSRGANGVVIITTKKGKAGKTSADLAIETGFGKVTGEPAMMNTSQYLKMRREAFSNDGVAPTAANAYDLLVWDTSRYTDFPKLLTGGTARYTSVQASVSGGTAGTQFLIGTNYRKETTVFPGDINDTRLAMHFSLRHRSENKKLELDFSAGFTSDNQKTLSNDLSFFSDLPPNFRLYDSTGKLGWNEGNIVAGSNPLAGLNAGYSTMSDNLINSFLLQYKLTKHLSLKLSTGYNGVNLNESVANPLTAQNPAQNNGRSASFATRSFKSWIVEPQAEYLRKWSNSEMDILLGSTWQDQRKQMDATSASGYSDDALLKSTAGATSIFSTRSLARYRYEAVFGRVNYKFLKRYIVNLSARRDGSSRFGANKKFASFRSVGATWVFSDEKLFSRNASFFSFGKLRGSYGTTGNDKITDYLYLDTWQPSQNTYQGSGALQPVRLYNPEYRWEKTTKAEAALDLGFCQQRIALSVSLYRNRSSNQLVSYRLPATTGFSSVIRNFPALVQNSGTEISLSSVNIQKNGFSWNTSFNLTIPRTRLLEFPGLAASAYASSYVIGQPLNLIYAYRYTGVDPQSGIYTFEDLNKDSIVNNLDRQVLGALDPKLYGGLNNSFSYKGFQLDIFFQFTKQTATNYYGFAGGPPGTIRNMPAYALNRWTAKGDVATAQKFTQFTNSAGQAYTAFNNFLQSNGIYENGSYLRLKNASLRYTLPTSLAGKLGFSKCQLSISGQNLTTITGMAADPETQDYRRLPPLKTIAAGILVNF